MTPNFAAAIDPIFLHVLGLLERIGHNDAHHPIEERAVINNWFRHAEAQLGQKQDWELAKYALVAWIDDVLIEAPWAGSTFWKENALEVEVFKSRDRATQFYIRAQEAAKMTRRDALEVFYVCVVLGFRGLYRDNSAAFLADQLGLPPNLDAWASQTSKSIQLGQGRPSITESPHPGSGAPPLDGKYLLIGTALLGVALAAVAVVVWLVLFVATKDRIPSTGFRVPSTQHPAPSTQHPALSTQHSAPSTQHPALSTQHSALSTQHPVLSTQYPAPSTQHPVPDALPRVFPYRIFSFLQPDARLAR